MISSISCPVCQNLCSSQAISCPQCGHPFPKQETKKDDVKMPAFLSQMEEEGDSEPQPFFIRIFQILAYLSLGVGILFGLIFVGAMFLNPDFSKIAIGLIIKAILGLVAYAFFAFLVSVGKRK